MLRASILASVITLLTTSAALAQENRSEFGLQATGFLTSARTVSVPSYSATQAGGILATYRYHANHSLGAEVAYGWDSNTQKYAFSTGQFGIRCNVHQMTAALVVALPASVKMRLSPYVLAGGGALIFEPVAGRFESSAGVSNYPEAQTQTKPVFVYGVGANYAVAKRVSLRLEYRGLAYSAPDFGFSNLSTNSRAHTAEPSAGLSFRF